MFATHSIESGESLEDDGLSRPAIVVNRRRWLVWGVVGVLTMSVLALGAWGVVGSRPCVSCHDSTAFAAQTQASSHASVQCRICHRSGGPVGTAVFVLQQPLHVYPGGARAVSRDAAAVPDSRCIACHETVFSAVTASKGIRMSHASCARDGSCTDCHSSVAHGRASQWIRTADMERCLECHVALEKTGCDLCHEDRRAVDRVRFSAFQVTHGPKWETTHGMGDAATCTVCHQQKDCSSCHGPGVPHEPKFISAHSVYAMQSNARCTSCHQDEFCADCHGTQMPHPTGFTRRHAAEADKQPTLCDTCHDESDCTNCHVKHAHPGGAVDAKTPVGGGQ